MTAQFRILDQAQLVSRGETAVGVALNGQRRRQLNLEETLVDVSRVAVPVAVKCVPDHV